MSIGTELEYWKFLVSCGDGTYIPLDNVRLSANFDLESIDANAIYPSPSDTNSPVSMYFYLDRKRRDHRMLMKMLRKQANVCGRWVRRYKRKKEHDRRMKLKAQLPY